jgi:hypothetical protein
MVNLLECLYALTTLSFLAALVMSVRGRRTRAIQFALLAAVGAAFSIGFYWLLSQPA